MRINRPRHRLHVARFPSLAEAGTKASALAEKHPGLKGLFVVWDTPASAAAAALASAGLSVPIGTVDLGKEAAISLSGGGPIVMIAAQQPFRQGQTAASTTVTALLNRLTPAWVALPGVSVTASNVVESFQTIWRSPAPREVLRQQNLLR
jgi:ribose transport system substrate-binding protein